MNILECIKNSNVLYVLYIFIVCALYGLTLSNILPAYFIHVPLILAFIPISYQAFERLKERKIGTELFLTIATIISLIGGQEKSMTVVLIVMLIAQYLEHIISDRTQHEIDALLNLIPKKALVKIDDEEKEIPIDDIKPGMLVIINTGKAIPVDGTIVQGTAYINESSLTGESIAQEKSAPQSAFAGTFVQEGSIIIKTEKVGEDTLFGKISLMVQKAEEKKAKISILTDKIAFYLVPAMLICIGITWLLTKNLTLVTTLLVFGSPLELTLITPLAILSGIIAAYRNGILVKGGLVLERMAKADMIIFDKTGTLTMGQPEVTRIEVIDPQFTATNLLTIAAIAQKRSAHLFAKAILKKAREQGISIPDAQEYISISGHGVQIKHNDTTYFLGNKHFIASPEHGNITISHTAHENEHEHYSSFYIANASTLLGKIYMQDTIRQDAKKTITDLKDLGIKNFILLSGDKQRIATHIGSLLDIPQAYGEVFPEEKLNMIEKMQTQHHVVVMLGDGINDAPALKQADVGIAMGQEGMEPAIDASDIVFINNNLYDLVFVYALSKRIFTVIRQNILIGFACIHGIGILLTFLGFIDPFKAILFHSISDLAIMFNSARLINFKIKKADKITSIK